MSKQSEMEYSLYRVKFPRQTLVKEPKLVGKTAGVVFEYTNDHGSQQEYIVAPIEPVGYITELLKWFNAEERAIEAMPFNDLGGKNVYKANLRHFIRIVPDHEILEETKMQIPDGTKCAGCKKEFHVNEYRHQYPAMVDNIILCKSCESGNYVMEYLGQRGRKRKSGFSLEKNAIESVMAEQISEPIKESLRNTATVIKDQMGRPRKVECPNVNTLKKKPTKTIKFGKWSVHEETFNDYVNAVREMRSSYEPAFDDGENTPMPKDPLEQLTTFQQRVKLHKKLFKEAGVPYHGNTNATKASHDLYALIEKRMEKEL